MCGAQIVQRRFFDFPTASFRSAKAYRIALSLRIAAAAMSGKIFPAFRNTEKSDPAAEVTGPLRYLTVCRLTSPKGHVWSE